MSNNNRSKTYETRNVTEGSAKRDIVRKSSTLDNKHAGVGLLTRKANATGMSFLFNILTLIIF